MQTTDLVARIRVSKCQTPQPDRRWPFTSGVPTAGGIDFSKVLPRKLPLFLAVIIVLAFLLLAAVFRSILVPLTASIMNVLSIGAALGVITAAFQFGWLRARSLILREQVRSRFSSRSSCSPSSSASRWTTRSFS